MSGERFLRQRKTGNIFIYTPTLAMRKDMVEYEPKTAKKRIAVIKQQKELRDKPVSEEQIQEHKEKVAEIVEGAKILTDIENQADAEQESILDQLKANENASSPKSNEELEAEARQKKIDTDPEIQSIRGMKRKADVEIYLMEKFGEAVPDAATTLLSAMKDRAEKLRIERIFEQ